MSHTRASTEPGPPLASSSSPGSRKNDTDIVHPFKNSKSLLIVIPNDRIDVEAESAFYDDFCLDGVDSRSHLSRRRSRSAPPSPRDAPSVFSNDIWLGDNSGESNAFARDVTITGWTSVGDKRGSAYIVYDCSIRTAQNTTLHAHKRYSAFVQLYASLRRTLPQTLLSQIPPLPPKAALAKFRPTFLDRRRRMLQHWLSAVLLHPDIGGCQAVRDWVLD
ncbi:Phox-like protein [Rickenella mellea]|uniref:Endosomal/vacuolar adapter protein YPT35 n=1 Tax=Rickenella mellea TaxID=50990 RepID=A0A4Y7Q410_9AGAM|nr:Phox-like protein [Rickenella mellea]